MSADTKAGKAATNGISPVSGSSDDRSLTSLPTKMYGRRKRLSVATTTNGKSPRIGGRLYHSHSDEALHTHGKVLPFLTEDNFTDVILTVEGKRLFTNKSLLGYASPVFAKRFLTEFKDQRRIEMKLPEKKYLDIAELISYLHPGVNKPLTDRMALRLLPIAFEYKMTRLKERCENLLITSLKKKRITIDPMTGNKETLPIFLLRCLKVADTSDSPALLDHCISTYSKLDVPIKGLKQTYEISDQVKARIFEQRMEGYSKRLANVTIELGRHVKEKGELKKRLGYEPKTTVFTQDIDHKPFRANPLPRTYYSPPKDEPDTVRSEPDSIAPELDFQHPKPRPKTDRFNRTTKSDPFFSRFGYQNAKNDRFVPDNGRFLSDGGRFKSKQIPVRQLAPLNQSSHMRAPRRVQGWRS